MADANTDYLIIGNSAAGVTAAETIRAHDPSGSITLVSREPYPCYGRPLISYLIEGKTTEDQIAFKEPSFYEDHRITTWLGPDYEAVELLSDTHEVRLANGDFIGYRKCLLATGSIPFTPPIQGLEGKQNVFTFITLDDALAAWKATVDATGAAHSAGRKSRVIVIGAGLIGLKAAESLSHHADEILVLELAPRILPAVLDDDGAAILQEQLESHGIICKPGITAEELMGSDDCVTQVKLTNGDVVSCDLVIAAVGVRPNSSLAVQAGAEQGRGLICDETLLTSLDAVYAAGDVVQVTDVIDGSERPLALWPNAMRQGRIAGLSMANASTVDVFEGSFPVNAVDFFDISLLTAGLINPLDSMGCDVQVVVTDNQYSKFVTRDGCLVGYILLNRPSDAGIYTAIIEDRIPLDQIDPAIFQGSPENLAFPPSLRWDRLHQHYPSDHDHLGRREGAIL